MLVVLEHFWLSGWDQGDILNFEDSSASSDQLTLRVAAALSDHSVGADTLRLLARKIQQDSSLGEDSLIRVAQYFREILDSSSGADQAALSSTVPVSDESVSEDLSFSRIGKVASDSNTTIDALVSTWEALKEFVDSSSGLESLGLSTEAVRSDVSSGVDQVGLSSTVPVEDASVSGDATSAEVGKAISDTGVTSDALSRAWEALREFVESSLGLDGLGLRTEVGLLDSSSSLDENSAHTGVSIQDISSQEDSVARQNLRDPEVGPKALIADPRSHTPESAVAVTPESDASVVDGPASVVDPESPEALADHYPPAPIVTYTVEDPDV